MALAALHAGHGPAFARALMHAHWGEGRDISQPEELKALAARLGLDGEALLATASQSTIKDELRSNTDAAIKRGVFGVPTFFVGRAMFWGNDRLPLLRAYLKGELHA
jgi:2-hydroxychromene-2-carboxylate isomerase